MIGYCWGCGAYGVLKNGLCLHCWFFVGYCSKCRSYGLLRNGLCSPCKGQLSNRGHFNSTHATINSSETIVTASSILAAAFCVPTHKIIYSGLKLDEKIKIWKECVEYALKRLDSMPFHSGEHIKVIAFPEYMFTPGESLAHFMTADEAAKVRNSLKDFSIHHLGNTNIIIFAGTMGWQSLMEHTQVEKSYRKLKEDIYKSKSDMRSSRKETDCENMSEYLLGGLLEEHKFNDDKYGFVNKLNTSKLKIVHNTALILYDGRLEEFDKKYQSFSQGAYDVTPGYDDHENTLMLPRDESSNRMIHFRGVTFGLEICSEHDFGALLMKNEEFDIQVVMSAFNELFGGHIPKTNKSQNVIHSDAENARIAYSKNSVLDAEKNEKSEKKIHDISIKLSIAKIKKP